MTEHTITREVHAAHTDIGKGWDLERIIVAPTPRDDMKGYQGVTDLPPGFTYHSGYVVNGRQFWIFYRKASFSPITCANCLPA